MSSFNKSIDFTAQEPTDMKTPIVESFEQVRLNESKETGATAPALTLRQKFTLVLATVLSSFAVGSIPVVYAFTVAQTQNATTTQTPIIRGEMF